MLFRFFIYAFCMTEVINFTLFLILMFLCPKSCPFSMDVIGLRVATWNL